MKGWLWLVFLVLVSLLSGCGGGGNSNNSTTVTNSKFKVVWPARSKDVNVRLTSAQSLSLVLAGASTNGQNVVVNADRDPSKPEGYTATYTVPQAVQTGQLTTATVTFYSQAGQTGDVVGTATAKPIISEDELILGSFVLTGTIETVIANVVPLTTASPQTQLTVTAQDSEDNSVAISPGSAVWALVSGANVVNLTPDGLATPVAPGTAQLTATVDGVTSAETSLIVSLATVSDTNFQIAWPDRSRAIQNPLTSAQSASLTLFASNDQAENVVVNVNRDPAQVSGYTGTYPVPGNIAPSYLKSASMTFYAQADQKGAIVGTATAVPTISGSDIDFGTFVLTGVISEVTALPSSVTVNGDPVQLEFVAKDAGGFTVAITPGSAVWSIASGAANLGLTADGLATALMPGSATVQATVDGTTSNVATVTVLSNSLSTVDIDAVDVAYDPVSDTVFATVGNSGANANSIVGVNPASGEITAFFPVSVTPNLIAVTDDGQYAYFSVNSDGSVRRLNLSTGTVDQTVITGVPVTIATIPGSPQAFAIGVDPTGGVNVSVYDDNVRRSGTGAGGSLIRMASQTQMYGRGGDSLFACTLTPTSINWTDQTNNLIDNNFVVEGGLIYDANGHVVDPVALTLEAQLTSGNFLSDGRVIAVCGSDNRIYIITWAHATNKRILCYDLTTLQELDPVDSGQNTGGVSNLVACGNDTVAFTIFGSGVTKQLYIRRNLP